jgi:hypothetical protein
MSTFRMCNGCTACCTIPPIPELDKPMYTECRFSSGFGCHVHGTELQPEVCCLYECDWLKGDAPECDYPPHCGYFLTTSFDEELPGVVTAMWEYTPDALKAQSAVLKIHELVGLGRCIAVRDLNGNCALIHRPGLSVPRRVRRRWKRLGLNVKAMTFAEFRRGVSAPNTAHQVG